MCSALDEDGDGQISQKEMECWVRWNLSQGATADSSNDMFLQAHKETLQQLVKQRDAYKVKLKVAPSGSLPPLPTEYDAVLTAATTEITHELFSKYDTSKDKQLQLDEFMKIPKENFQSLCWVTCLQRSVLCNRSIN